jgi:hypothetical protein
MASPTKGTIINLIALGNLATITDAAGTGLVKSAAQDVSTAFAAQILVRVGRTDTTVFTASTGVDLFVQGLLSDTVGDLDQWADICGPFSTGALAACNKNTLTNTSVNAAGNGCTSTYVTLTAVATVDYGLSKSLLYFMNGDSVPNGEFHHCRRAATGDAHLWLMDDLVRNQYGTAAATVLNGTTEWDLLVDLAAVKSLRVVLINNSGVAVHVRADLRLLTAIA